MTYKKPMKKNRSRKDANIKKWQGNVDHTVKHVKMLPIQQFNQRFYDAG